LLKIPLGQAYYRGDPLRKLAVSLDRKPFNGHPIPEGVSKQDLLEKCPEYQVIDLKEAFSCRSNAVDMADYQARLYKISDAEIAELKEQCNLSEDVKYVSAFDCISAALEKASKEMVICDKISQVADQFNLYCLDTLTSSYRFRVTYRIGNQLESLSKEIILH
jgi:hypothetical protein